MKPISNYYMITIHFSNDKFLECIFPLKETWMYIFSKQILKLTILYVFDPNICFIFLYPRQGNSQTSS